MARHVTLRQPLLYMEPRKRLWTSCQACVNAYPFHLSPLMSDIEIALKQLQDLCTSIQHFATDILPQILYRAPVIDWHHPDDYSQSAVTGLRKFLSAAEAERDHVAGVN